MATYVEINNIKYPAVITGRLKDHDWDDRASKEITLEMTYMDAINIFVNDVQWNIVQDVEHQIEKLNDNDEITFENVIEQEVYDNSEYNIAGDIIDHRNGKVTVKMGKPTAEEQLVEMASVAADAEYQLMLSMKDVEE